MRISEILAESIKSFTNATSELTSSEVFNKLSELLRKYEKKAKSIETTSDSIPAAPNTGTFRASRSGEVSITHNETIHGAYNSSVTYDEFLKIGGAIPYAIRSSEVDDAFLADASQFISSVASENTHITCSDNQKISIRITHGTNWGGIGIRAVK